MTENFKTEAAKLREQEMEFFKIADINYELEDKTKQVLEEYDMDEKALENIEKGQLNLMKELNELDSKIDDDSYFSNLF